jgi:cytochrome P450
MAAGVVESGPHEVDLDDIDLCDLDRFAHGFPHATFAALRDRAPVWFHPPTANTPGGEGFWVLSRYDDVAAAAADGTTFSSHCGGPRSDGGTLIEDLPSGFAAGVLLNMMDDPRHQQIRKLCLPSLSPARLRTIEADLRSRAESIVADAVEAGEVDFLRAVAAELPLQAVAALLGVPQDDRHLLFGWANATLDYDDRQLGESSEASAAAAAEMYEYGQRLIAEKRRRPTDDLLSAVIAADLPVGGDEVQMFFSLLIAAGSETTRNSIAVGADALAARPEDWAALRDDRSLLPSATEEILRWASSTTYNRRTATVDTTIGGRSIAAGDKVTLWWGSANHDERAFPDPSTFDIRREPNRHLAFGHGGHFCLGAHLARAEIRLVLDVLVDRVDRLEPTGPIEWVRSNKHTGVRHLPMHLVAR